MYRDDLLAAIHKVYRKDKWIRELFQAAGLKIDDIADALQELNDQLFVDTATWALEIMEKDLGITPGKSATYEDRRSSIIAKNRTKGKVDIALLQSIADAWKNGEIEVKFIDGKIYMDFVGESGIPKDLDALKQAMENAKPAHLAVVYAFRYLLIKDIHNVLTVNEMQELRIEAFAGGKKG